MQIFFDRLFAKNLQLFFAKLVQFVFLCQRLSKKLNFIKIWQVKVGQNKDLVCYRKKQTFRQCAWGLRQSVLKPGFRPKGEGFGYVGKVSKFQQPQTNTLSYVKIDPPPSAGIGLNLVNWFTFKWFMHFDMLFLLVYNDGLYSKTALSSTGGAVSGN